MRLKTTLLFGFTLLLFTSSFAQTDSSFNFTLAEAQEFAIDHYFMSKNSKLDIDIAKKKIWETTAMGLPQVSATIDYAYMPEIPEVNFPNIVMGGNKADDEAIVGADFRDENFYSMEEGDPIKMGVESNVSYQVMVTQLIFSGEYIVGLQASKVYSTYAKENYEKVTIDLKENIASTYYAIKIVDKNAEVLEKTLENLKLNLSHTQKFFDQGLAEDTDVDQLTIVVKRTENSLNTIKRQQDYLLNLFKYQLGLDMDVSLNLKENLEDLVKSNIIGDEQYVFDLAQNIDYKLLSTQEDLMNLSMKREKSTFLPQVSGFYQYNDQFEQADFNMTIKHIIGASVSIPIASSGMKLSKVSQAKIELEKARNMKEQEAQRLILTADQSQYDYRIALQNYLNEKENFELSERVFNKTTIRFKEGVVSALDLSMVNNQYLEAQLSLATATQELLMAKIALDKAHNKL